MITLADLMHSVETLEAEINVADEQRYRDLFDRLWEQRNAFLMAASHLIPITPEEAKFLHGLIDEYSEFVADEPARESDKDDAIAAIARINDSLREYAPLRLSDQRAPPHLV